VGELCPSPTVRRHNGQDPSCIHVKKKEKKHRGENKKDADM
jgi:hypothetical protein